MEGMAPRARAFHAGAAQGKPLHDRQQLFKQYEALKALDENALAEGLEKFLKVAAEGEPGVRQSALALAMLQFKRVPEDRKGDVVVAFLKAGMSLSQLETMTRRLIQRDGERARRQVVQVVVRLCVDSPHAALTMVRAAAQLPQDQRQTLVELVFDLNPNLKGGPGWAPLMEEFLRTWSTRASSNKRDTLLHFAETSGALHVAATLPETSVLRKEAAQRATLALDDVSRLADLPHVTRLLHVRQLEKALEACLSISDPQKRRARLEEFRDDCRDRAPGWPEKAAKCLEKFSLVKETPTDSMDEGMPALRKKTHRDGK